MNGRMIVTDKQETSLYRYSKDNNVSYYMIANRIRRNWQPYEAANRPKAIKYKSEWLVNGKPLFIYCREAGLAYNTIRWRLNHDWELQRALDTPIRK